MSPDERPLQRSGSILPFVSVIVPAFNEERRIGCLLDALTNQSYPSGRFEIIIVDNGSTDGTLQEIKKHPVRVSSETQRSSYAARIRGVRDSRGEILAFTDADCVPDRNWIQAGVDAMINQHAELVAGRVSIYGNGTISEWFDVLHNLSHEESVRTRGIAFTANLFVKKSTYETVGGFDPRLKSGGDVLFTAKSTKSGRKLVYCNQAVVRHPARLFRELMSKAYRIGLGKAAVLPNGSAKPKSFRRPHFSSLWLPNLIQRAKKNNVDIGGLAIVLLWICCWTYLTLGVYGYFSAKIRQSLQACLRGRMRGQMYKKGHG